MWGVVGRLIQYIMARIQVEANPVRLAVEDVADRWRRVMEETRNIRETQAGTTRRGNVTVNERRPADGGSSQARGTNEDQEAEAEADYHMEGHEPEEHVETSAEALPALYSPPTPIVVTVSAPTDSHSEANSRQRLSANSDSPLNAAPSVLPTGLRTFTWRLPSQPMPTEEDSSIVFLVRSQGTQPVAPSPTHLYVEVDGEVAEPDVVRTVETSEEGMQSWTTIFQVLVRASSGDNSPTLAIRSA